MGNRYKFTVDISVKNRGVTGSCIMVCVHRVEGDVHFLIDCGLYQGKSEGEEKNYYNFDFKPENVDFMVVTHAHADHSGRVPLLYKRGFFKKCYCSEDTGILLKTAFYDDAKVIAINARHQGITPLYNSTDVERSLKYIVPVAYKETITPCEGVRVTLFKNAHIVGAAFVLVQIESYKEEDINLLFTGDYNCQNIFFDAPELPSWVKELPLHVICESTYGYVDSTQTDTPVFRDNIVNWLKEGKKAILIPTLSLGRYQEIAYVLKSMQKEGLIDPSIPIRFDGKLAIHYTNAYKNQLHILPRMKDFMPQNSSFVTNREEVINYKETQIIVTTSGDGNFGPAPEYIDAFIERHDAAIHYTSYLQKDSNARKILATLRGDCIAKGAVLKRKNADVKATSEFSGHAKRDQLLQFLNSFGNIRSLHITHGEPETKEEFAKYCKNNIHSLNEADIAIAGAGYTMRVDQYRIVKSILEKKH